MGVWVLGGLAYPLLITISSAKLIERSVQTWGRPSVTLGTSRQCPRQDRRRGGREGGTAGSTAWPPTEQPTVEVRMPDWWHPIAAKASP